MYDDGDEHLNNEKNLILFEKNLHGINPDNVEYRIINKFNIVIYKCKRLRFYRSKIYFSKGKHTLAIKC